MNTKPRPQNLKAAAALLQTSLHAITENTLASDQDESVSGLFTTANTIQQEALSTIDTSDLDSEDQTTLSLLTMAATLQSLKDFCDQSTWWNIRDARKHGATWQAVALATGYSSPSAAAQRFDPKQRKAVQAANRRANRERYTTKAEREAESA